MFSFKLHGYGNILKVTCSGKISLPWGAVVMFKVLEFLFFSSTFFFLILFRLVLLCSPFSFQLRLLFLTSGLDGSQFLFVLGEKNLFSFTALAQLVCCLPAFRDDCLHYYFICIEFGKYCDYNCCLYWVPLFHWQEAVASSTAEISIHGSQHLLTEL